MESHTITQNQELVLGKLSRLEGNLEALKSLIAEKLNPQRKEFLTDRDLEDLFGLTRGMRYALVESGRLRKYKASGKTSPSLYKYDEVIDAIEKGIIQPKKV